MTSHHPEPPTRRSFLNFAVEGLGAIFALIFGTPVVAYLIDPRNRPAAPTDYRPVDGVADADTLEINHPVQGVIRNIRRDSWTLYPDDVIGRVWINKKCEGNGAGCYEMFSTTCPHLGCAINCNQDAAEFKYICPCHDGQFKLDGERRPDGPDYTNPAPRDMYAIEFRLTPDNKRFEAIYKLTTQA